MAQTSSMLQTLPPTSETAVPHLGGEQRAPAHHLFAGSSRGSQGSTSSSSSTASISIRLIIMFNTMVNINILPTPTGQAVCGSHRPSSPWRESQLLDDEGGDPVPHR